MINEYNYPYKGGGIIFTLFMLIPTEFTHWSNEIYDTPNVVQDNQNVYLTVSPNDTVILECSMAGNYLRADVDWAPHPENHEQTVKLPNGNLLVKYFSETTPGSFLCTILESDLSNAHLIYNIQVDKNGICMFVSIYLCVCVRGNCINYIHCQRTEAIGMLIIIIHSYDNNDLLIIHSQQWYHISKNCPI